MPEHTYYKVNGPSVINETIEGESVIINLETGFYYSLDNIGAIIWDAFNQQISAETIAEALSQKYADDKQAVRTAFQELIKELLKENLIVVQAESTPTVAQSSYNIPENAPATFVKPVLQKFGDMQDLLLLDPIHEVDEQGWPHANPQNPPRED